MDSVAMVTFEGNKEKKIQDGIPYKTENKDSDRDLITCFQNRQKHLANRPLQAHKFCEDYVAQFKLLF